MAITKRTPTETILAARKWLDQYTRKGAGPEAPTELEELRRLIEKVANARRQPAALMAWLREAAAEVETCGFRSD